MKELMNDYWEKTKVNPLYVEFLHDGQSIDPNDTPMGLGLVNGDQIEAISEQKQEQEESLKLKVESWKMYLPVISLKSVLNLLLR